MSWLGDLFKRQRDKPAEVASEGRYKELAQMDQEYTRLEAEIEARLQALGVRAGVIGRRGQRG